MLAHPNVLLLTSDESEAVQMENWLYEQVQLTRVRAVPELRTLLARRSYDAALCAWSLYTDTWKDALEEVRLRYPDLPLIVLSRTATEGEWQEVMDAGGWELLVSPYRSRTFLSELEPVAASRPEPTRLREWPKRKAS